MDMSIILRILATSARAGADLTTWRHPLQILPCGLSLSRKVFGVTAPKCAPPSTCPLERASLEGIFHEPPECWSPTWYSCDPRPRVEGTSALQADSLGKSSDSWRCWRPLGGFENSGHRMCLCCVAFWTHFVCFSEFRNSWIMRITRDCSKEEDEVGLKMQ